MKNIVVGRFILVLIFSVVSVVAVWFILGSDSVIFSWRSLKPIIILVLNVAISSIIFSGFLVSERRPSMSSALFYGVAISSLTVILLHISGFVFGNLDISDFKLSSGGVDYSEVRVYGYVVLFHLLIAFPFGLLSSFIAKLVIDYLYRIR